VLVGWSNYGRPDLADLPAVGNNLMALAATFDDGRFSTVPPECVAILADPTRPHDTGIELTAAASEASDLLLVYLAGHLELGPAGEPQFPLAAGPNDPRPGVLGLSWVAHCLAQSSARHKILILDAHLLCAIDDVGAFGQILVGLCEQIPGVSTWIYGSADLDLYSQPAFTSTAMTGALLESVHRGEQREPELDLVRLHEYTAHVMRRNLMPTPRLYLSETARNAMNSPMGWLALFGYVPTAPSARDGQLLRALRQDAVDAERSYHLPAEAAETYRALVVASQRILGPDHVDTLRARQHLARWTGHAGDARRAAREYQRLFEDQRRVLGVDHEETVATHSDIKYWSQR
jgi:hypothetical protein